MYLSRIHLTNWRSYADSEFRFQKPTGRRPLVLVGALNGHGKTSLLFSLYVGLFGRFGLRHAEGFTNSNGEDVPYYREAIRKFRRSSATSEEPTSVELVFTPTSKEEGSEIRIVRRWFFSNNGSPKSGDAFETLELYLDGKPQKLHTGIDAAIPRLERFLFRADVMPAFFFDGEQAQTLINNSGQDGMKKAVEVLFGTRVVEEALDATKQFIRNRPVNSIFPRVVACPSWLGQVRTCREGHANGKRRHSSHGFGEAAVLASGRRRACRQRSVRS